MSPGVRSSMRWCLSLASKFKRVAFWCTSIIVLLTLASQISMILAFFLPLKVVILLGSDGIPRYFPEFLQVLGHDTLILALSLSAVMVYTVHLIAERLINTATSYASSKVLLHNKKVVLFQNQDSIASNAYKRFSRVLSASVFFFLSLAAISYFYPDMSSVLVCYILISSLFVNILDKLSPSFQVKLRNNLQNSAGVFAGIGFFVSFVYLVIDFSFLKPPSVTVAILSLLLCRQIFGCISGVIKDVHSLSSQRVKIDALFFHKKVLLPNLSREEKSYWSFLEADNRAEWVDSIISGLVEDWKGCRGVFWHSSSTPGIAVLVVDGGAKTDNYLIKLYDPKNSSLAMHESTLLSESPAGLPAPEFVGISGIANSTCQVYRLPCPEFSATPKNVSSVIVGLRTDMLKVEPPAELFDRYQRSKALLWQRLSESEVQRIGVAVSSVEESELVDRLLECLPDIKSYLRSLPHVFINPDVRPVNIFALPEAVGPVLVNWGRWSIEPIGFGFGVGEVEINQIAKALNDSLHVRHHLEGTDLKAVELVAFLSTLEERCGRHQFNEALDVVGPILERVEALGLGFSLNDVDTEML